MFHYTALFLIIVLVSAIVIWMYRGIFGVARSIYKATTYNTTMPVSKKTSPSRLKARRKVRVKAAKGSVGSAHSDTSEIPAPRGWKGNSKLIHSRGEVYKPGSTKVLWNGLSNQSAVSEPKTNYFTASDSAFSTPSNLASRKHVGWPHKEEKMNISGNADKVNRKAADGKL